jgi:hypothetical protein
VQAQSNQNNCLINQTDGNQVSGTVEYVSYQHPYRDVTITGYKLILLKPRCFESMNLETDKIVRTYIKEIAIYNDRHDQEFLKNHTGKTVIAVGNMQNIATAYYVASPQIYPDSIVACEVEPKTKGVEKC